MSGRISLADLSYFADIKRNSVAVSKKKVLKRLKKVGYQNLPKDMKLYLTYFLEPLQVIETCKDLKCDWKKLMDLNYDFVTQGFAIGRNDKEKFRYLANRVSKNVGVTNPEIIFIYYEGQQLGDKKLYNLSFNPEVDDPPVLEEEIAGLKERKEAIVNTLKKSDVVEWVRHDDYNYWIKVKNRKQLPREYIVEKEARKHRTILRDVEVYDYSNDRIKNMKQLHIEYPGKVGKLNKEIFLEKLNEQFRWEEDSPLDNEELNEEINNYNEEGGFIDKVKNHSIYEIMRDLNMNRTFSEAFLNVVSSWKGLFPSGNFIEDLNRMYK